MVSLNDRLYPIVRTASLLIVLFGLLLWLLWGDDRIIYGAIIAGVVGLYLQKDEV